MNKKSIKAIAARILYANSMVDFIASTFSNAPDYEGIPTAIVQLKSERDAIELLRKEIKRLSEDEHDKTIALNEKDIKKLLEMLLDDYNMLYHKKPVWQTDKYEAIDNIDGMDKNGDPVSIKKGDQFLSIRDFSGEIGLGAMDGKSVIMIDKKDKKKIKKK